MSTFRFVIVCCLLTAPAFAQRTDRSYPPQLADAKTEVYKTVSDTPLRLYIFNPQDLKAGDHRPAVVFSLEADGETVLPSSSPSSPAIWRSAAWSRFAPTTVSRPGKM